MDGITLYSIQYYNRTVFKGSFRGMNFRIAKGGDDDNKVLVATAWKGPFILEKTEEQPMVREFEYTDEGLAEAEKWLEEQQPLITGKID